MFDSGTLAERPKQCSSQALAVLAIHGLACKPSCQSKALDMVAIVDPVPRATSVDRGSGNAATASLAVVWFRWRSSGVEQPTSAPLLVESRVARAHCANFPRYVLPIPERPPVVRIAKVFDR